MARPLNYDYHNYIIFYKKIQSSNPVKRELTYKNSVFNIIKARSLSEAMVIARKWAFDYAMDYIPYHARRYNIDTTESIETLRKRKNYLYF